MGDRHSQNCTTFRWTQRHKAAAVRVAEDRLSDEQIAAELGISRRTLEYWKVIPEFQVQVAAHVERFAEVALRRGIARRERRLAALNNRWERMHRVIDERAADPDMEDVPGGRSGLLVHQIKMIGFGKHALRVDEYAVDVGLLREMRELEKQAAQEMGQWAEKHEHTGQDGRPLEIEIRTITAILPQEVPAIEEPKT